MHAKVRPGWGWRPEMAWGDLDGPAHAGSEDDLCKAPRPLFGRCTRMSGDVDELLFDSEGDMWSIGSPGMQKVNSTRRSEVDFCMANSVRRSTCRSEPDFGVRRSTCRSEVDFGMVDTTFTTDGGLDFMMVDTRRSSALSFGRVDSQRPHAVPGDAAVVDFEGRPWRPHPLEKRTSLMSCVSLVHMRSFKDLPLPLPRWQELPEEYFGQVQADAQVVSVSHAWRNQAHPDPTTRQAFALRQLLSMVPDAAPGAPRFLFLDFLSIPQRPFMFGQAPRSSEEATRFEDAVRCMHEMYFYSDFIVHLPWQDGEIEGEGQERLVEADCLRGCTFFQFHGGVQVSTDTPGTGNLAVRAFDVVVDVDEVPVESVEQLQWLLKEGGTLVRLRSYPFGVPNLLSADNRGWVFLERFITMVKCAMMEEEQAREVVITSCPEIEAQILAGAARLRKAAQKSIEEENASELKRTLHSFLAQLAKKQFSAASMDKQEDDKASISDREAVTEIMRGFVRHLSKNWSREARVQQGLATRAARAAKAAKEFLVKWPTFSDGYAAKLEEASKKPRGWPLLRLALTPCVILALLMIPVEEPVSRAADVLTAPTFYFLVLPIGTLLLCGAVPTYLFCVFGLPVKRRNFLGLYFWLHAFLVASVLPILGLTFLGLDPPPLQELCTWLTLALVLPALWCFLPQVERSPELWWRLVYGYAWFAGMLFSGLTLPCINANLPYATRPMRAVMLLAYLGIKVKMEMLSHWVSHSTRLGTDVRTSLAFNVALQYEIQVCVSFVKVTDLFAVGMQICFNLLENGYHILSLRRLSLTAREEQYLVASLVTREFVELLAPLQFLLVYLSLVKLRPENVSMSCRQGDLDVERTVTFTLLSFSIGLIVSLLTYIWLRHRGQKPLCLLFGLLATRPFFWIISICSWAYSVFTQHSHLFNDYSLQLPWRTPGAEWLCGYLWLPPR